MDYEKKYKEALAWMKDVYPTLEGAAKEDAEHYFPELKESIDERVKKVIRQVLNESTTEKDECYSDNRVTQQEVFGWLEKKGERIPIIIIPKFRVGDIIRIKGSNAEHLITEISDGYYRGHGWCLDIIEADKCGDYELVEQNHAWSEEDLISLGYLADFVDKNGDEFYGNNKPNVVKWIHSFANLTAPKQEWSEEDKGRVVELIDTFESMVGGEHVAFTYRLVKDYIRVLKLCLHQSTWKPSKEQIIALRWVLNNVPYCKHKEEISGLLDQIKEL